MNAPKRPAGWIIGIYITVTALTVAVTVAHILRRYTADPTAFDGICLSPLFFLLAAEGIGYHWWKDNRKRQRCNQFVIGKIVERKYIHRGNAAGYAPVVRFETNGETYTVEINIVTKSWGTSTNCTVGDEYYLLYNAENPREIIPCSSGFDDIQKMLKITAIVLHIVYVISMVILITATL